MVVALEVLLVLRKWGQGCCSAPHGAQASPLPPENGMVSAVPRGIWYCGTTECSKCIKMLHSQACDFIPHCIPTFSLSLTRVLTDYSCENCTVLLVIAGRGENHPFLELFVRPSH